MTWRVSPVQQKWGVLWITSVLKNGKKVLFRNLERSYNSVNLNRRIFLNTAENATMKEEIHFGSKFLMEFSCKKNTTTPSSLKSNMYLDKILLMEKNYISDTEFFHGRRFIIHHFVTCNINITTWFCGSKLLLTLEYSFDWWFAQWIVNPWIKIYCFWSHLHTQKLNISLFICQHLQFSATKIEKSNTLQWFQKNNWWNTKFNY